METSHLPQLFLRQSLERRDLTNCDSLTIESLAVLIDGKVGEINCSTDGLFVSSRRLKYLDLTQCCVISHPSTRTLVDNIPEIEDLRVSGYRGIENAYTCAKRQ